MKDITFDVQAHRITSIIGPSGSGKSTLLRSINRMNDLIAGTRVEGKIMYHDEDLYASYVDPVEVRRRIGMVFQKPNPFPKSIYDNVAFGPRLNGFKGDLDGLVEQSLRRAAIWDEVKDKLKQSGTVAVRRAAAAAVHRPGDRDRPRGHPDGRAVLRARSPRDAPDRGADGRDQGALHDRHRDPQHAAGGTRVGQDGLPQHGRRITPATSWSRATPSRSSPIPSSN